MKENKKKRKQKQRGNGVMLKRAIAVLAVINLILLFGFDYQIPGLSYLLQRGEVQAEADASAVSAPAPAEETGEVRITLDTDTLTYDGTGELNLLEGVKVIAADQTELATDELFAKISEGESKDEKVITYTYAPDGDTKNEIRAVRTLKLTGYAGVSLAVVDPLPEITDSDLENPAEVFLEKELITAQDGYGKDISSSITASVAYTGEGTQFEISFSVTNMFGDKAGSTVTTDVNMGKPWIGLTQKSVSLKTGDSFQALDYLEYAIDRDGTDIKSRIQTEGEVDTTTAGTYEVVFRLENRGGEPADEVTLQVKVTE